MHTFTLIRDCLKITHGHKQRKTIFEIFNCKRTFFYALEFVFLKHKFDHYKELKVTVIFGALSVD